MLLRRTEKGSTELRARQRSLGLRERGVLFLADGSKPTASLVPVLDDEAGRVIARLLADGYLEPAAPAPSPAAAPKPAIAPPSAEAAVPEPGRQPTASRRSLAATRMYLFELCERLLARQGDRGASLRERLRDARDRESMLAVAEDLLAAISDAAGAQRADALRGRIEELLPEAA